MIKVIAFDVFGTVFDIQNNVPRSEIADYVKHVHDTQWRPLEFPEHWKTIPAHLDAAKGIYELRKSHLVVTCSNGPMALLAPLSKHNNISWDAIIPLETARVYKPNPGAYLHVCALLGVEPEEVMMVTANRTFGDLEASAALGMTPQLIRDDKCPTIIDLADHLNIKT